MDRDSVVIRPVQPEDNKVLAKVLRKVLVEMGVPKKGTAYEDTALNCMYETYQHPRMAYFVAVDKGEILGGAGIAPLPNEEEGICELQKMYFLPELRGKGIGSRMMETCLDYAKQQKFEKCYLETMPTMTEARKLYKRTGFTDITGPMGNTGHYNCQAWMLKTL
ncbi:GNAT family N-acetyltransferase [Aquimarina sp. ERC-38]|nr:GNAT family N-acetyltransferase [Aquimarina sp. ERC-38]